VSKARILLYYFSSSESVERPQSASSTSILLGHVTVATLLWTDKYSIAQN